MRHKRQLVFSSFFFFNDTATTEIYTLSLHDALPISNGCAEANFNALHTVTAPGDEIVLMRPNYMQLWGAAQNAGIDRKSTRLNSSHVRISYAVFCLKKKKK